MKQKEKSTFLQHPKKLKFNLQFFSFPIAYFSNVIAVLIQCSKVIFNQSFEIDEWVTNEQTIWWGQTSEWAVTLSISLSLSYTHAYTHTIFLSHTLTHTLHSLSLSHTHTHTHTHWHPFPHFCEWLFPDLIMTWRVMSSFVPLKSIE